MGASYPPEGSLSSGTHPPLGGQSSGLALGVCGPLAVGATCGRWSGALAPCLTCTFTHSARGDGSFVVRHSPYLDRPSLGVQPGPTALVPLARCFGCGGRSPTPQRTLLRACVAPCRRGRGAGLRELVVVSGHRLPLLLWACGQGPLSTDCRRGLPGFRPALPLGAGTCAWVGVAWQPPPCCDCASCARFLGLRQPVAVVA